MTLGYLPKRKKGANMDNIKIANKLKDLRVLKNKTQHEVAGDLGISRSAIDNYERGIRVPRDEIKVKLANYYGVGVESIFFNH